MSKLPALDGQRLMDALAKAGFVVMRVHGSHHFLKHPDGRTISVPLHAGEAIGHGLLAKILRDTELKRADLIRLLKS